MTKVRRWSTLKLTRWMKTNRPHPIINKLKYAVRHSNLWRTKTITNKKKEQKKEGGHISEDITK